MAITDDFTGLPIGLLICQPIIEVAKGQAELCNVYLDQLFRLAFKTMPDLTKDEAVEARTIKFKLNRTVATPRAARPSPSPWRWRPRCSPWCPSRPSPWRRRR